MSNSIILDWTLPSDALQTEKNSAKTGKINTRLFMKTFSGSEPLLSIYCLFSNKIFTNQLIQSASLGLCFQVLKIFSKFESLGNVFGKTVKGGIVKFLFMLNFSFKLMELSAPLPLTGFPLTCGCWVATMFKISSKSRSGSGSIKLLAAAV